MTLRKKQGYPSPCETCEKAESCKMGFGCAAWQIRYRYRQKQINAFAQKILQAKPTGETMFAYRHPDETRRYLAYGPCNGCKAEQVCNTPCPAYLRWWNARMELTRRKVGA